MGESGISGGVSGKKREYLAQAYRAQNGLTVLTPELL